MSCISNVNNKPSITYTNRIFNLLKATSFLLSYGLNRSNEFGFFCLVTMMSAAARHASGKSGYEHLSIPKQTSFQGKASDSRGEAQAKEDRRKEVA